jgi:hypothetical protein
MKKAIIPVLLALLGLGGGAATGLFLLPKPAPEPELAEADATTCPAPAQDGAEHGELEGVTHETPSAFVALENQFIVPLLEEGSVAALVVLSISIETGEGEEEAIIKAEPRLRDGFLQVLFDHANTGGFDGTFTATEPMRSLRLALDAVAEEVIGEKVRNVLIVDIVRQDV